MPCLSKHYCEAQGERVNSLIAMLTVWKSGHTQPCCHCSCQASKPADWNVHACGRRWNKPPIILWSLNSDWFIVASTPEIDVMDPPSPLTLLPFHVIYIVFHFDTMEICVNLCSDLHGSDVLTHSTVCACSVRMCRRHKANYFCWDSLLAEIFAAWTRSWCSGFLTIASDTKITKVYVKHWDDLWSAHPYCCKYSVFCCICMVSINDGGCLEIQRCFLSSGEINSFICRIFQMIMNYSMQSNGVVSVRYGR